MTTMNCLPSVQQISLLAALQRTGTGTTLGTGQDVSSLEGMGIATLDCSFVSGTSTLTVFLEESDTVGGTYTAVANGAFTVVGVASSVQKVSVEIQATKKFVRARGDAAGTSPVYTWGVQLLGFKKYN